jgi:hypothetical protein
MAEHRKNHLVAASYLDGWTGDEGLLRRVPLSGIASEARRPESVGYRRDFWGDEHARRRAERMTAWGESQTVPILRELDKRWPLEPEGVDWLFLSLLLFLHEFLRWHGRARGVTKAKDAPQMCLFDDESDDRP